MHLLILLAPCLRSCKPSERVERHMRAWKNCKKQEVQPLKRRKSIFNNFRNDTHDLFLILPQHKHPLHGGPINHMTCEGAERHMPEKLQTMHP